MSEEHRELAELLDRLTGVLERRAVQAWTRSPESFFEELDDLNLALELRQRIEGG